MQIENNYLNLHGNTDISQLILISNWYNFRFESARDKFLP
jgi:hypothetical protein